MNVADIYFDKNDIVDIVENILVRKNYHWTVDHSVIKLAVDETLAYVVEWLDNSGRAELADELHLLTDGEPVD